MCGNTDGLIECWDPRAPPRQVATLDCCLDALFDDMGSGSVRKCAVTAMKFRDGLNLAVGTSTGHVIFVFYLAEMSLKITKEINFSVLKILLYDIRSNKPYTIKDHRYELPIKAIEWHTESDLVLSIDKRVCKIWDRNTVRKKSK